MNKLTIGIPRGLFYYRYETFLNTFFNELKVNILVSPNSNKDMFNIGNKLIEEDSCPLLKTFLGHVSYLDGKVDYILIPRIHNFKNCNYFNCLYEIINNIFNTNILDVDIDNNEQYAYTKLCKKLGFNIIEIENAYKKAKKEEYRKNKIEYLIQQKKLKQDKNNILIICDDYIYKDDLIKKELLSFVKKDEQLIYSSIINPDILLKKGYNYALNSNLYDLKSQVNRIINITTQSCVSKKHQKNDINLKINSNNCLMENYYE